MKTPSSLVFASLLGFGALVTPGCENDENQRGTPSARIDSGAEESGGSDAASRTDSGFSLLPFSPPPANPGSASVLFTISGEALATEGFAFPPAVGQEVKFVDGWQVEFERLIVTVDALTLSADPDKDPNAPAATGAEVARADGPWAVDIAKDDPTYPAAKGGEGRAVPLAALTNQNKSGGGAFDTAGVRYAFGFKTVAASASAINVNLGPAALADYEQMTKDGCSVLYVGSATWKGDQGGNTCSPAPGQNATLDGLPKVVSFKLCFKTPTDYVNCQNPDNDPAAPLGGEDHQRGISFKDNTFTTAQLTLHTDHSFWTSVEEDAPSTFDQFAAAASTVDGGTATVTMADLAGVDFGAVKDKSGAAIPWRNCVGDDFTPPGGNMSFYSGSVQNVGPTGDPKAGLRHLADFSAYITSTQGHLNADGLCFAKRNYDSPN